MQKHVYVILTRTLTISGKVIRKISKNSYSHASIALDETLNEMYSFARYRYQNPLVGGFVHENVQNLSLGKEEEVIVKIFKIPVTNKQYQQVKSEIEYFKKNEKKYMYNLFGLVFFPTRIQFKIKNSYICTEFVTYLLKKCHIEEEKLNVKKVSPSLMTSILKDYEYYDGSLQKYISTVEHQEIENSFLEKENFLITLGTGIRQIGILLFRKFI